jgi:hypothetical protein
MTKNEGRAGAQDLLDVRRAAALVGRHPETIRRWVWSGRLAARREGNRLLMARRDVEALAKKGVNVAGLAEWADHARAARAISGASRSGGSAAELVIEDREHRSHPAGPHAGR